MTHNLTHNRKRAGGSNGVESTIVSVFRNKNAPKAPYGGVLRAGYQLVRTVYPIHVGLMALQKLAILLRRAQFSLNRHTFSSA